jgi:hypothetical protein
MVDLDSDYALALHLQELELRRNLHTSSNQRTVIGPAAKQATTRDNQPRALLSDRDACSDDLIQQCSHRITNFINTHYGHHLTHFRHSGSDESEEVGVSSVDQYGMNLLIGDYEERVDFSCAAMTEDDFYEEFKQALQEAQHTQQDRAEHKLTRRMKKPSHLKRRRGGGCATTPSREERQRDSIHKEKYQTGRKTTPSKSNKALLAKIQRARQGVVTVYCAHYNDQTRNHETVFQMALDNKFTIRGICKRVNSKARLRGKKSHKFVYNDERVLLTDAKLKDLVSPLRIFISPQKHGLAVAQAAAASDSLTSSENAT